MTTLDQRKSSTQALKKILKKGFLLPTETEEEEPQLDRGQDLVYYIPALLAQLCKRVASNQIGADANGVGGIAIVTNVIRFSDDLTGIKSEGAVRSCAISFRFTWVPPTDSDEFLKSLNELAEEIDALYEKYWAI